MSTVSINWERAEIVFGTLLRAFKEKAPPYDLAHPPQISENLPKSLVQQSVEHGIFLLCVCYWMRGGNQSDVAIQALGRLYDKHPLLFSPTYFDNLQCSIDMKADLACDVISTEGALRYNAEEVSRHWVINFAKLMELGEGDPAKLFSGISDYETAYRILMRDGDNGFLGFQEKMASMLLYFLMDAGMIKRFLFPVPVDFHVLRIMISHGLLVVSGMQHGDNLFKEALRSAARELSYTYCKQHDVDPITLGDTMWLLSRSFCRWHPGNRVRKGIYEARRTILTPLPVVWTDTQREQYNRSCGVCSVQDTCLYNVPSAHYYVSGRLVTLRERARLLF